MKLHSFFSVLVLALALTLTGCPKKAAVTPDGGTDGGADGGELPPPRRTLVEYKLFGDMPLDNGVLDPQMDLSAFGWFAFVGTQSYADVVRQSFARTPTRQPVLAVPKTTGQGAVSVAGFARGGEGPLAATVWLGRPLDAPDFSRIDASVIGYDPTQAGDVAVELAMDTADDAEVELDGIVWQRWTAVAENGFFGWTLMYFGDSSDIKLYITGPVLAKVDTTSNLTAQLAVPAKVRGLMLPERQAADRVRAELRKRMRVPETPEGRMRAEAEALFEGLSKIQPVGAPAAESAPTPAE